MDNGGVWSAVIGLIAVLTISLLVVKVFKILGISWLTVFMPVLIPFAAICMVAVAAAIAVIVEELRK